MVKEMKAIDRRKLEAQSGQHALWAAVSRELVVTNKPRLCNHAWSVMGLSATERESQNFDNPNVHQRSLLARMYCLYFLLYF